MLLDSRGSGRPHLRILLLIVGDQTALWPPRVLQALHVAATVVFCILWRELIVYYDCYPWLLAALFNKKKHMEERREAWRTLMRNRRPCCFDAGLTSPLLRHFLSRLETMSLDEFLETKLARFLEALLIRIVVTSTPVEMSFSMLTALTTAGHQQRIGRHALSSKMCIYGYDKQVTRWR